MSELALRSRLRLKAVALDLDGVVYLGDRLIEGADTAVRELQAQGLRVGYLTNNSGKTRAEIAAKLGKLGIPAEEESIFNTAYAAGQLLRTLTTARPLTVMVVGTPSLQREVALAGAAIVESGTCDYVIVGLDATFNYARLAQALHAVCAGARIIACNRDTNFPVEGQRLMPGCGPLVAALETASETRAAYVVGKPETTLLAMLPPGRTPHPRKSWSSGIH